MANLHFDISDNTFVVRAHLHNTTQPESSSKGVLVCNPHQVSNRDILGSGMPLLQDQQVRPCQLAPMSPKLFTYT